ncbi:unnamed protein product, partial [Iphiclides podalirius]
MPQRSRHRAATDGPDESGELSPTEPGRTLADSDAPREVNGANGQVELSDPPTDLSLYPIAIIELCDLARTV